MNHLGTDVTNNSLSMNCSKNGNFPVKLHYVLSEMNNDGLDHIMSWQPHGRCFTVRNRQLLEQMILPLWFCQSKFSSFQRQLNIYGFTRITSGPDKGGYYHELFLRGKPSLATKIPRLNIKGEGARKPCSSKNNPNLYAMPSLHTAPNPEKPADHEPTNEKHNVCVQDTAKEHDTIDKNDASCPLFSRLQAQHHLTYRMDLLSACFNRHLLASKIDGDVVNSFFCLSADKALREASLKHTRLLTSPNPSTFKLEHTQSLSSKGD